MAMGRKQRKRYEGDYLDLVPRRLVEAEAGASGQVVLLVPRYRDPFWGRVLQPYLGPGKRHVRVPLDTRGAALWEEVDGRRSVRDLVGAVGAVAHGDSQDLPRRVCLYVQALADNGFLALDEPDAGRVPQDYE
ncbi:MAG: PqqD family protein [bacterium]|nr:PqqD family protein [bacterium]